MNIKIGDYFELNGKKNITLDSHIYNDKKYIFVNELTEEEEPTKVFRVYYLIDNGLVEENNKEVLDELLKVFSDNMNKKIEMIKSNIIG